MILIIQVLVEKEVKNQNFLMKLLLLDKHLKGLKLMNQKFLAK